MFAEDLHTKIPVYIITVNNSAFKASDCAVKALSNIT